jgi:hypothetical protein
MDMNLPHPEVLRDAGLLDVTSRDIELRGRDFHCPYFLCDLRLRNGRTENRNLHFHAELKANVDVFQLPSGPLDSLLYGIGRWLPYKGDLIECTDQRLWKFVGLAHYHSYRGPDGQLGLAAGQARNSSGTARSGTNVVYTAKKTFELPHFFHLSGDRLDLCLNDLVKSVVIILLLIVGNGNNCALS